MRTDEERPDSVERSCLERLVDGDLPESERRKLLLHLDSDPEGWRRCALAFLEDQSWRQALASFTAADSKPAPAPSVASENLARSRTGWIRRSSIAASLMASTFAAGFAAGGFSKTGPHIEIAESHKPAPVPVAAASLPDEVREVGSLELVNGSAGESRPKRFPIHAGPNLDDRWLRSQPPSVPPYLKARLERQGYQVAERREFVSVELGDGRRVSIPVDEVEVVDVGQKPL